MSLDHTHEDVQAALAAEALGALDGADRAQLRAHLEVCAECQGELDALREAAAMLAHAAPRRPMDPARSERLRARLLARAAADRADAGPATVATPVPATVIPIESRRRSALPAWLAAAASVVVAFGAGAYALSLRGELDALQQRTASLSAEQGRLRTALAEREAAVAALSGPEVRVVELASTQQREPAGRMFWNPRQRRYTFFAYNLPPSAVGREYQLWLITPAGPVAAPAFQRAGNGRGTVQGTYDIPNDQIRAFAVTDEPIGGLPKPSGQIVIVGNAAATE